MTYGGKESADWLKSHLGVAHDGRPKPGSRLELDVEFDTVEDTIVGCRKHNQENYGRLLAYVHVGGRPAGENLSLAVVRAGRSPTSPSTDAADSTTPTSSRRSASPWRTSAGSGGSCPPSASGPCP